MWNGENAESREFKKVLGGKIYSLRMARAMTQAQFGELLGVSPAAVSKWERNLAYPDLEILCDIADRFDCSLDELMGRSENYLRKMGIYDSRKARMAETADTLMECCELARQTGFLALSEVAKRQPQAKNGRKSFLTFAIEFFIAGFYKKMDREMIFSLLENYANALPQEEQREGRMIVDALQRITSGENPEVLSPVLASYIGMEYYDKLERSDEYRNLSREELLGRYQEKTQFSDATGLLREFQTADDFELRQVLSGIDEDTFVKAMRGADGDVVIRFLKNFQDSILRFVCEDIDRCEASEEEMTEAQRRMLEAGAFALVGDESLD